MTQTILIIDFGSQVTELIARRIREFNIYSIVKNPDISFAKIKEINPRAIILSGGPASVNQQQAPAIDRRIFDLNIPILGICYGQQLICKLMGGQIADAHQREFGHAIITITQDSPLFKGFKTQESQVWMSHGDRINTIPDQFEVIAKTDSAPFAAIAWEQKKIYGVQFHPEVIHSLQGAKLLKNFVVDIAACQQNWTMKSFKKQQISSIKQIVGDKKVICGLSGGVDSAVTAALIHQAIGNQLTCIFVDNGLLRKDEGQQVKQVFENNFHINLIYVDAGKLFLSKLNNISDPEQKRKIIGKTFIEIFDQQAAKIKNAQFLAQGTLYPDVIESLHPSNGGSKTIKSHHNVGGLPKNMKLKLLEPIRSLFKDEVRKLGIELGLSKEIISRHPFPGPGLAIRIPGKITTEKIQILQKADAIYLEEITNHGLYDQIWQAFCVLLPVKTVGVMGDNRSYEYVLSLRAVTATDGMTAQIFPFSYDFLTKVTGRIIGQVRGINRVVYDCTSKPPGTIEWE